MNQHYTTDFPTHYPSHDRPTHAEINLDALRKNYSLIKKLAGSARIMAMVKAEAYGHGLIPISRTLSGLGVDYLGVSFLEEGVALREAGLDTPILVMGGLVDEQIERYLEYDIEITVSSAWKGKQAESAAIKLGKKAKIQIKIDTGMGRVGNQWNTAEPFFQAISKLKHTEITGIYSHFACSDSLDSHYTKLQLERFQEILLVAERYGIRTDLAHIANSGALLQYTKETRYSMVRPGIMLYGWHPTPELEHLCELHPVMTLKSAVVYVKYPPAGTPIGYGSTYMSPGNRWIATLPIGYGDGYPRRAGNRGFVLINGKRCPIVGRVSMDMLTVDCGDQAYLGDQAVLFGGSGTDSLSLWELSGLLDTIPYELTTCLTSRVPRIYLDNC